MGRIRITYEIITPESAEDGDAAERGWIDEEGEEYDLEGAIELLAGLEPSSTQYHEGVWYSDPDGDEDYATGAREYRAYHLVRGEWSEDEQKAIFLAVAKSHNYLGYLEGAV